MKTPWANNYMLTKELLSSWFIVHLSDYKDRICFDKSTYLLAMNNVDGINQFLGLFNNRQALPGSKLNDSQASYHVCWCFHLC